MSHGHEACALREGSRRMRSFENQDSRGSGEGTSSRPSRGGDTGPPVKETPLLDKSILSSAISSGMPTFLLTKGVPIIDRRARRLISAGTLARNHQENIPPRNFAYPPDKPLCLRGHTPTTLGPSKIRVRPPRSNRGPRGATDVAIGEFKKPGVLGGLSVSPWIIEEEMERASRMVSHETALSKDPVVFRRKRQEGGLLDYAEETHAVRRFLDKIHPIRDESCRPKSGFSYRRVCHCTDPPDFYDTSLDSVRPRTVGYSPGHVRALSPTPSLTWGGREDSRASLDWANGTGGSLGAVEACLGGISRGGSTRITRTCQGATSDQPGASDPFADDRPSVGDPANRPELSVDGSGIEPQQFDTTQRRSEYTCALMAKRQARQLQKEGRVQAEAMDKERQESAADGQQGIEKFEGSLKQVLAQKWKYL